MNLEKNKNEDKMKLLILESDDSKRESSMMIAEGYFQYEASHAGTVEEAKKIIERQVLEAGDVFFDLNFPPTPLKNTDTSQRLSYHLYERYVVHTYEHAHHLSNSHNSYLQYVCDGQ